jgi:hypothetical protein
MSAKRKVRSELDYQHDVVDLVNNQGGFGLQLNNRFIIGVVDLFVKPRGHWPAFIEVKKEVREVGTNTRLFDLDVTVLQRNFLRRAARGDMRAGVLSLIVSRSAEYFRFISIQDLDDRHSSHRVDSEGAERIGFHIDSADHKRFNSLATLYRGLEEFCGPCPELTSMKFLMDVDEPTGITASSAGFRSA